MRALRESRLALALAAIALSAAAGCGPWLGAVAGGAAGASSAGGGGGDGPPQVDGPPPGDGPDDTPDLPPIPRAAISATKSDVKVEPKDGIVSDGVASATITITVRDVDDDPVAGVPVEVAATGTGNQIGQPAAWTDARGIATASIASTKAEKKAISAKVQSPTGPLILSDKPEVTFVAGTGVRLFFAVEPLGGLEDSRLEPAVQVAAADSYGNAAEDFTGSVTIEIGSNPGGGTLSGTTTRIANDGIATFGDLVIDREGVGYTLRASAVGLPGAESAPFNVGDVPVTWSRPTTTGSGGARVEHAAGLDVAGNVLIVFGGQEGTDGALANDVVVLSHADGTGGESRWRTLYPSGEAPAPRAAHSAVYDAGSNRLVVFGGNPTVGLCGQDLGDVWALTGADGSASSQWIPLATTAVAAPGGRSDHSAVYDPGSNRMIVFGGIVQCGSPNDELWALTNANGADETAASEWIRLYPLGGGPSPRYAHAAAYDRAGNRMIVYGGASSGGGRLSDVWVLTNANGLTGTPEWVPAFAGNAPPPRANATAVYTGTSNLLVVFGGDGTMNDIWALSNANLAEPQPPSWAQVFAAGEAPPPQGSHTAVFRPGSSRMTIYGGRDCTSDPCAPIADVRVLLIR